MDQPQRAQTDAPQRLGVREFRSNMTEFLRQAKQGKSFIITSRNEVVAELHPPSKPAPSRRLPGALRGKIIMAPDFDTLPDDLLAAMEGEAERSSCSTLTRFYGGWLTVIALDSASGT